MLRSIHESNEAGEAISTIERRDPRGRTLDDVLRDDQLERVIVWERRARRLQRLFNACPIVGITVWFGCAVGFFTTIFGRGNGNPLPTWQLNSLLALVAFCQFGLPRICLWLAGPVYKRQLERVIAAAQEDGVELNPSDYPELL